MRLGLHGSCEAVILTYGYAILATWSGPLSLVSWGGGGGAYKCTPRIPAWASPDQWVAIEKKTYIQPIVLQEVYTPSTILCKSVQQQGSCILKCTMPHTGTRTHMGSNEALYSKGKKGRYTRESNQEQLICISGYISGYMVRWSKRKSSILIVSRRDTFRQHVHAFLISGYHNEYPYNLMVSTGVCSSSLMG